MSFEQIFGWANVVLAHYGMDSAIRVVLFIGVAVVLYNRFLGRRD